MYFVVNDYNEAVVMFKDEEKAEDFVHEHGGEIVQLVFHDCPAEYNRYKKEAENGQGRGD